MNFAFCFSISWKKCIPVLVKFILCSDFLKILSLSFGLIWGPKRKNQFSKKIQNTCNKGKFSNFRVHQIIIDVLQYCKINLQTLTWLKQNTSHSIGFCLETANFSLFVFFQIYWFKIYSILGIFRIFPISLISVIHFPVNFLLFWWVSIRPHEGGP